MRRHRLRAIAPALFALLVLAMLFASPTPAPAQAANAAPGLVRRGLYVDVGLARGAHTIQCRGCSQGWFGGWSGSFTLGWTLRRGDVVGMEAALGSYGHSRQGFGAIGPVLIFHPARTGTASGLFLRTGPQFLAVGDDGPGFGVALSGAIGYDIPLDRRLALTPSLSYRIGAPAGATSQLVQAGLALTLP